MFRLVHNQSSSGQGHKDKKGTFFIGYILQTKDGDMKLLPSFW
jgi:hypothetical protein